MDANKRAEIRAYLLENGLSEELVEDLSNKLSAQKRTNQRRRNFGSDGEGVTYTLGSFLPPECDSVDLKPAIEHKSAQNVKDPNKFESFFIERVAKFACACINRRCNGTIFFGVGDNKVSSYNYIK